VQAEKQWRNEVSHNRRIPGYISAYVQRWCENQYKSGRYEQCIH